MEQSKDKSYLLELFNSLSDDEKNSLIDYAEFLQSRSTHEPADLQQPVDIERPSKETVVGAIKRLKSTYPMIESMSIFSAASSLMTEHMVNGRDAIEVIDEMQELFEQAYENLLKEIK